jgi:hypothetical protein
MRVRERKAKPLDHAFRYLAVCDIALNPERGPRAHPADVAIPTIPKMIRFTNVASPA